MYKVLQSTQLKLFFKVLHKYSEFKFESNICEGKVVFIIFP